MKELPLYSATIEKQDDGIYVISLVDDPATEVQMVCFQKDTPIQKFAIQNEEKRLVYSVVMVADTPIYRVTDDGYEYNMIFTKETIVKMAEKMLSDNVQNVFSLQHNGHILPANCISMRESFIIDRAKGIDPEFFANVPDGSLVASLHINDDELWEMCKNGNFGGISIEALLSFKPFNFNKEKKNITLMSRIKQIFKQLLTAFGAVEAEEATLYYDGELVIGVEVVDEEGNVVADGEYHTDGMTIVVVDGKVAEIVEEKHEEEPVEEVIEAEEETATVEETVEEPAIEEPEYDAKAEIETLKAEIEAIKKQLEELLATPATEPIQEEFTKKTQSENKYAKLGEAIKGLK